MLYFLLLQCGITSVAWRTVMSWKTMLNNTRSESTSTSLIYYYNEFFYKENRTLIIRWRWVDFGLDLGLVSMVYLTQIEILWVSKVTWRVMIFGMTMPRAVLPNLVAFVLLQVQKFFLWMFFFLSNIFYFDNELLCFF